MKKMLILAGRPIGTCEIVRYAKANNVYTIVTDYLPKEQSPGKMIADEYWDVSTGDVEELEKRILSEKVDAIMTGVHGFNINKMAELAERLNIPCYCTTQQRATLSNKKAFKELCIKNGINVSKEYCLDPEKDDTSEVKFPVIVKPADNGGSIGFSKCNTIEELVLGYKKALQSSPSKSVLIEEFNPNEAVIIHYTVIDGNFVFSGMSDKISMELSKNGSSVMAMQLFPSKNTQDFIEKLNDKTINMFKELGIKDGPIWIEAFNDNGNFTYNEMGFRFGGSLTYFPVQYFYGINQLECMFNYALGINKKYTLDVPDRKHSRYCIMPIHLKAGIITEIAGEEEVKKLDEIEAVVRVHYVGDEIENWGTAQQVFCYLHITYDTTDELLETIEKIKSKLSVKDHENEEMLLYMFDLKKLNS